MVCGEDLGAGSVRSTIRSGPRTSAFEFCRDGVCKLLLELCSLVRLCFLSPTLQNGLHPLVWHTCSPSIVVAELTVPIRAVCTSALAPEGTYCYCWSDVAPSLIEAFSMVLFTVLIPALVSAECPLRAPTSSGFDAL